MVAAVNQSFLLPKVTFEANKLRTFVLAVAQTISIVFSSMWLPLITPKLILTFDTIRSCLSNKSTTVLTFSLEPYLPGRLYISFRHLYTVLDRWTDLAWSRSIGWKAMP